MSATHATFAAAAAAAAATTTAAAGLPACACLPACLPLYMYTTCSYMRIHTYRYKATETFTMIGGDGKVIDGSDVPR